ncbi:MAG: hypothetical protein J6X55_11580, partial [Victivallales bacterium]|nr:hypothetical protein [Victivallales bacterium]
MNSTLQLAHDEAEKYQLDAEFIQETALPSFEVRRVAGRLVIAAPTPLETLYGVYECAERFGGYTFFEPGRDRFDAARRMPICAPNLPNETLVPARHPRLKRRGFIQ